MPGFAEQIDGERRGSGDCTVVPECRRRMRDRRLWMAKVESPEPRIDGERRGSGDCSGSTRSSAAVAGQTTVDGEGRKPGDTGIAGSMENRRRGSGDCSGSTRVRRMRDRRLWMEKVESSETMENA